MKKVEVIFFLVLISALLAGCGKEAGPSDPIPQIDGNGNIVITDPTPTPTPAFTPPPHAPAGCWRNMWGKVSCPNWDN